MYNLNLSIGEFHLVFGTLQEKKLKNEKELNSLVRYELYDEIIENQERYNELLEENKNLDSLLKKLYDDSNNQLNSKE